jgi:predicted nucleic acid-binding protein
MRLVVADTGPLNYLVLIEAIELLPRLFERVFTPEAVRAELLDQDAPAPVRAWAPQPPGWLDLRTVSSAINDPAWRALDLADAFTRLKATSFRYPPEIMDALLVQHAKRDRG